MSSPDFWYETEPRPQATIAVPISETLQSPVDAAHVWPELSASEPLLAEQVAKHSADIACVQELIDTLPAPDVSLQEAVETGLTTAQQVGSVFQVLSDTLDNPDYARLALYLPFEFLPAATWTPKDSTVQAAANRFRQSYMTAWYSLLGVHDVRANFVDGDVLEEVFRDGDLPRVVKAAHLVPQLLDKGMLGTGEVTNLLQHTTDPLLAQSISEALGIVPLPDGKTDTSPPSERRKAWLAEQQQAAAMTTAAKEIAASIQDGLFPADLLEGALSPQTNEFARQTLVEGIYQAIATGAEPGKLYDQYSPTLDRLWGVATPGLADRLISTAHRLHRLGVISDEQLAQHDISVTTLAAPLSENLKTIPDDIANLQKITAEVAVNPELSAYIYPVAVIGGSLLKGYGNLQSDVDVSVFVKPNTPREMVPQLRELLHKTFADGLGSYEPIEFWLERPGESPELQVHNFAEPDQHVADKYWTHILFNGAWVGDQTAVAEIQKNLLPGYFYDSTNEIYGVSERQLYLERIEQDTLQYRLMHQGFARHNPLRGQVPGVDDSVFWDPGYRQLATQLFMHNVFLPKLES